MEIIENNTVVKANGVNDLFDEPLVVAGILGSLVKKGVLIYLTVDAGRKLYQLKEV